MKAQDIIDILEFFEHLDLTLKEYFVDFIFQVFEIDDFDGDWLVFLIVTTSVDAAGVALSDLFVQVVGVVFYFFSGVGGSHLL